MWKKAIILLLTLTLASTLIACSGNTVDRTNNGGIGSSTVDASQSKESEADSVEQRVVDPEAIPLKIYGITIEKYKNYSGTSEMIGNPSSVKEVEIRDVNGNYLMTFNSGKSAGVYDHLRLVDGYDGESPIEWFDSITPDNPVYIPPRHGKRLTLDVGQGKWGTVGFLNFTDAEVSVFDLECKYIALPPECSTKIIEELGTPTAIDAAWDYPMTVSVEYYKPYVNTYYAVWKCDGFYAIATYSTGGSKVKDESGYNFELQRLVLVCSENGIAVVPDVNPILYHFGWTK